MTHRLALALASGLLLAAPAEAQTVEELQRQIDELKATVRQLQDALGQRTAAAPAPPAVQPAPVQTAAAAIEPEPATEPARGSWADRIRVRGYTQMRINEIVSGDATAPDGISRLRSVHDGGISDRGTFSFRRIRLVFEGDLSDDVAFYFQPDFANAISNQTAGERREGFAQLRDAYVDWFPGGDRRFRLRFGQSKVPFGWENLQSSSNRITLDRSDGINSAIPSERDIGIVAYATPSTVQAIWDRLDEDGQKLFGNYGAFGVGVFNGQGVNRTEQNDDLLAVVMATWPFELDGMGLPGQVLELGGAAMRNRVQPELRAGGVSADAYRDERVGLHAILYPQPFGIQAEWNWGRGPEYDPGLGRIATRPLSGGYVQGMWRVAESPIGEFMPYARWQRYRGGWKAGLDAPRLETDELEIGIEFQPIAPIEITVAFAHMERREADIRRMGRAEGELIRTQIQWNY